MIGLDSALPIGAVEVADGDSRVRLGGQAEADSESGETGEAIGFAASAVLHALLVGLLLLASPYGVEGSHGMLQLVPIEIAPRDEPLRPPPEPQTAELPERELSLTSPESSPSGPVQGNDALEMKLRALATLSRPDSEVPASPSALPSKLMTAGDDAAPGRLGALRDFIRDQVERHWSLNLDALGKEDFSIPLRIEIARNGSVLKAEIVNTSRADDPVYRDVAASARNAVLASSPLSLPAGEYPASMELILSLNPRDTLH
jgi:hypothetical protein